VYCYLELKCFELYHTTMEEEPPTNFNVNFTWLKNPIGIIDTSGFMAIVTKCSMKSMDYMVSCHIETCLYFIHLKKIKFKTLFFLILFKWWVFNTFVDIVIYFIQFDIFLFKINVYVCFNNGKILNHFLK
jgi:hypothetical protein